MNAISMAIGILAITHLAAAQESAPEEPTYARILIEEARPRCFASARSPQYPDRLLEGQIVRVGDKVGAFHSVILPLGVTGYVHKKFAGEPEDGMVAASATNVSFRYRQRSSEAPALLMPKGTKLYFLGEENDWWVVRNPAAPAYLSEDEIQVFETPNDTLEESWGELDKTRREEWKAAEATRVAAIEAAAEIDRQSAAIDAHLEAFRAEAAKPAEAQSFTSLTAKVDQMLAEIPEESPVHARAVSLRKEIEQQQLIAASVRALAVEAPTRNRAAEILPEEVEDRMSRFDAIGWLYHERPLGRPSRFTLQKGGKLLYVLTCNSGRYDLDLLDGVEVGIVGTKRQPNMHSVRELDAMKIEILNLPR